MFCFPHRRATVFLAIALALALPASASPRGDGWNLHKAGRDAEALPLLQQAAQDDPNDAKAQWFLALVLKDMNRPAEALQALQAARRIDPSLAFTENPGAVARLEQSLARKAGAPATPGVPAAPGLPAAPASPPNISIAPPQPASRPSNQRPQNRPAPNRTTQFSFSDSQMMTALKEAGVFVSPAMQSAVNAGEIAAKLRDAQGRSGSKMQVRVLVVEGLPPQAKSVGHLAEAIHKYLALNDDGLVIVVTGRPRQLGIFGGGLRGPVLTRIAQNAAHTFDSEGYGAGVAQIVGEVEYERSSQAASGLRLLLFLIGIPAVLLALLMRRLKKRRAVALVQTRDAVMTLSGQVAREFEDLDSDLEYAIAAETDDARRERLREARRRASEAFSAATRRTGDATKPDDYRAAQAALQAARAEMQRARNVLEGKPEFAGLQPPPGVPPVPAAPSRDPFEIPPLGQNLPGAQPGYALDFFTSQPVPRDQMVPVDLDINGQRRRVWASPASAQAALAGNPQIAALPGGGGPQPWFDAPHYNPWQSYGAQALTMVGLGLLGGVLLDQALAARRGWYHAHPTYPAGDYTGTAWNDPSYRDRATYDQPVYQPTDNRDYDRSPTNDVASRDDSYDNRMDDAGSAAGASSLDSPFSGGDWFSSTSGDNAGSASLDVFGSDASSGGDRS